MVYLVSFIPVLVLGDFSCPWRTGLLNVRLLKPGFLPVRGGSIPRPLIVRLEFRSQGHYPAVYLNASPMSLRALPAALQEALSRHPFRIVYFEADSGITWQDAVTAIDIIRGERAEVVMLTPGTKRDANVSPTGLFTRVPVSK
jgi:hypothetical protein